MNESEWAEGLTDSELAAVLESMVPTVQTIIHREIYRETAKRLRSINNG